MTVAQNTRNTPHRLAARLVVGFATGLAAMLAFAAAQWSMQPKESKLTFVGEQAGAQFEGAFEKFTADIRFDPADLTASRFDVKIDTASVNTQDGERDDTIKSADLFDVKRFPTARYVADKFTSRGGNKYSATGKLTLRNVTRDVPIEFTFENKDGGAWLKGSARIKRLDFGVGQGDWQDTATVGNDVQVRFALRLKSAS
ncbi:YceI family protein [Steroidobacter sp. S1-65]|uniref:YceI family protein n=1 Tax=Steroidobacter gossypii TaxID=2805490 RepID=A0ABS1WU40_9GAMM|nr:YceI family protein [Steroidobacter gossypii]MBM0104468.1 YceI family protein [Steroidobacter gossypii]